MRRIVAFGAAILALAGVPTVFAAEALHFLIMSPADPVKEEPGYQALSSYLRGANPVKKGFGCRGFVATTVADFIPTFLLLRKAGIDPKTFDFVF